VLEIDGREIGAEDLCRRGSGTDRKWPLGMEIALGIS